ncbi:uncharacterized protein Fot_24713 [Forsythia ovata]|uniref:Uncharacterized protein n=1 Tax=Forsythia ovata TaxID=205694 RepID=A0ABD1U892_9LAMI
MVLHVRSNSFPSKSHPVIANVVDQICRLKSSEEASVSASSICTNLASLTDLHEDINNLIQLPSAQQALAYENGSSELLDGSLKLVEICGIALDVLFLTKESTQELESSLRRNRGIDAYMTSRKNIDKMVKKCIKNLKSFDQCSTALLNKDSNVKAIGGTVKEAQAFGISVLKSALTIFASKQKTWSLVTKFTQTSRVHSHTKEESKAQELYVLNIDKLRKDIYTLCVQNVMKQLKESEMIIQELEENIETLFRSLVKTRIYLLNVFYKKEVKWRKMQATINRSSRSLEFIMQTKYRFRSILVFSVEVDDEEVTPPSSSPKVLVAIPLRDVLPLPLPSPPPPEQPTGPTVPLPLLSWPKMFSNHPVRIYHLLLLEQTCSKQRENGTTLDGR